MIQDIVDIQAFVAEGLNSGDIPGGSLQAKVFFIRDNEGVLNLKSSQYFKNLAGFECFQRKIVQKDQLPLLTSQTESRFEGRSLYFFGKREGITSWHGAEDRSPPSPQGRSPGTCTSSSRSLLPPGFCPSPSDQGPVLRGSRPFSLGSEIPSDNFVEKRRIDLGTEDPVIQLDIAHFLISNIIDR